MAKNFVVSSHKTKFQFTISEKVNLEDPKVFSSDADLAEFISIINDIFSSQTHNQAYFEILTIEKVKPEIIEQLNKQVIGVEIGGVKISFTASFIRSRVSVMCFMIRREADSNSFFEIRIASAGNVDAGKSTLLGVLTNNILDDGRGLARQKMFRFRHEIESGRTSSVGESVLSIDSNGVILNHCRSTSKSEMEVVPKSAHKIINFLDLAGHEKYLKTTIYGLVGLRPDYIMVIIGSNMGLVGMSREHLGLSLALDIPVFFILTKIDICPDDVKKNTIDSLVKIIKSNRVNKKHIHIRTDEDVVTAFVNLVSNQLCPIFQISCVTGEGVDHLLMFLSLLPARNLYDQSGSVLFWIDEVYNVPGVGCVVSGIIVSGIITKITSLVIGPNADGQFIPHIIKSIHRKRTPVESLSAGQSGSFSLKKIKSEDVRKGMVIVSPSENPTAYWRFKVFITILHHPTTILLKYQAMIHTGLVRQACSIVWMEKEFLRTGDKAHVILEFMRRPEYLVLGSNIVFREGRTKAIGVIKSFVSRNSIEEIS